MDPFTKYTIDNSLLRQLVPIAPGDTVIIANRYIRPKPFAVTVDHVVAGDTYTDPKIVTTDDATYPLSVCFAAEYIRYIVEYTFDDGLSGKFKRYTREATEEFIAKNKPVKWTLWGENANNFQFALDNWRNHLAD